MICRYCGAELPEGLRFCTSCGSPLTAEQPAAQPYRYGEPEGEPRGEHPVVAEVKRFACSPLFLAAVILFSLSILFSFVGQYTAREEIADLLEKGLEWMGDAFGDLEVEGLGNLGSFLTGAEFRESLKSSPSFSLPIFPILTAVGLWMIYAAGKRRDLPVMNPGGLKMVKVIVTIQFVLAMVGLGLGTLALGITAVTFGLTGRQVEWPERLLDLLHLDGDAMYAVVLTVLILLAVSMLISLIVSALYYGKLTKSMGTVLNTAATGVPSDRISAFAAVLVILSGVSNLSGILSLARYLPDAMLILSSLAGGVASILFGVIMLKYRTRMRELMMGNY